MELERAIVILDESMIDAKICISAFRKALSIVNNTNGLVYIIPSFFTHNFNVSSI